MSLVFCNVGETSERRGGAHMGFTEHIDTILNWTVKRFEILKKKGSLRSERHTWDRIILCWQVHVELAVKTFKENAERAIKVLLAAIPRIAHEDWTEHLNERQVGQCCFSSITLLLSARLCAHLREKNYVQVESTLKVRSRVCVCVCVSSCCLRWILTICCKALWVSKSSL